MNKLISLLTVVIVSGLITRAAEEAAPVRVACVGDSITFGHGVADRARNCYPAVLGQLLGAKYVTKNFGNSGATLLKKGDRPYWGLAEFKQAGEDAPGIVVIKLGTNDSKPQNWKHKEDFAADLAAMVDHFAALPSKPKIFLCLPVPVYKTQWGINEATVAGEIIPIIKKVAAEKKAGVIDLHAALAGRPELFPDHVHPNAAGAKLIAQAVQAAIAGK